MPTGYLHNGLKWLLVDGKGAISAACCCGPRLVCLPRIPTTVYAVLTFTGVLASMNGTYPLTWREDIRAWVGKIPATTFINPFDIYIVLNEDQSPKPQVDPAINNGGIFPDHICLLFSLRCGAVDGPFLNTYVASSPPETHDPNITGHWSFDMGYLDCFTEGVPVEHLDAIVVDDLDLLV
jgi:hypothetical protein